MLFIWKTSSPACLTGETRAPTVEPLLIQRLSSVYRPVPCGESKPTVTNGDHRSTSLSAHAMYSERQLNMSGYIKAIQCPQCVCPKTPVSGRAVPVCPFVGPSQLVPYVNVRYPSFLFCHGFLSTSRLITSRARHVLCPGMPAAILGSSWLGPNCEVSVPELTCNEKGKLLTTLKLYDECESAVI